MTSAASTSSAGLAQKRGLLLGPRGWAGVIAALTVICVLFPVLNLAVPQDSVFHVSDYAVQLTGKILCYAICALAMGRKSYRWQRLWIVAGTFCGSVVHRMNLTWSGGSSIVLSSALNAAEESMCTSSMM